MTNDQAIGLDSKNNLKCNSDTDSELQAIGLQAQDKDKDESEVKDKVKEPDPRCKWCRDSRQWVENYPGGLRARHPFYACTNEDSPKFGLWLTAVCSGCPLYKLDLDKLGDAEKQNENLKVPKAIKRKLRIRA